MKSFLALPSPDIAFKYIRNLFDKTDLKLFATVMCVGLINNFYFIISRALHPDALSNTYFRIAGSWEASLGRPLIRVLDTLRFGFVNQLLIVLVCLFLIAMSVILLRKIFKIKNKITLFLLAVLICTAPQFTEVYEFLYCADSYLFAFFLSILAVFVLTRIKNYKKDKWLVLCAITIIAMTCSLYQAFLGVTVGLTILATIQATLSEQHFNKNLRYFLRNMTIIFIGICFYYVMLKVYCIITDTTLASYKGANSIFSFDTILSIPRAIINCYIDFAWFFFTDRIINNNFYRRQWIYAALFILITFGFICKFHQVHSQRKRKIALVCILILILPVGINIINLVTAASGERINILTAQGVVITSLLLGIVFNQTNLTSIKEIWLHWATLLSTTALIITFIISNTYTYIYCERRYDYLETAMQDIYIKATLLDGFSQDQPWLFSNTFDIEAADADRTNGVKWMLPITYDSYSGAQRYTRFLAKYMGIQVQATSSENYQRIVQTTAFREMPPYPAKDSIKIIDGNIVIKVSEETF